MSAVHLRPTELGWKGALLGGAMAAAYTATAYHNLFFLLLLFGLALGALDALWALANVGGIRIARLHVPFAPAGEPRPADLLLLGRRQHCGLEISLVTAAGSLRIARGATVAGATAIAAAVPPLPRGLTAVRAVRVASRQPFGLFTACRDLPFAAEIVTGPAIADAFAARTASAAAPSADAIGDLRPFRAGDAPSRVHWKATARRGAPVVKQPDAEREPAVIVVDRRVDPAALDAALAPAAIELAASRTTARRFRLRSQGADLAVAPHEDPEPVQRWLATVAALPPDAPPPLDAAGAHG